MILLFAPILSVVALATGAVATVVAILLNGPRRMRRRPEPPIVVLPPVPTPEMERAAARHRAAL